ncbi:uncharacterized protein LOC131036323 isoform X2 [Cryptomeria japonica]|nr:uncharacterized protein LOC131036323 isoform X2 [Cryptomeria japonica]
MATGSGKSLCYQMPALLTGKTALVISPLISLMQDQVMSLQQKDIKAQHLSSAQTSYNAIENTEKGEFDIVYMTPERACSLSTRFWSRMMEKGVSLLAIDEAHCISEWGHDFRQEYKELNKLRNFLPQVPFVALTATATERVRLDIMQSLKLINPYRVISSFDRPNLYYGVKTFNRSAAFREELASEIAKDVKGGGSTIVYCTTIKDTEEVFESIKLAGIEAGHYHGQMSNKARESVHRSFIKDELQVMVATVAFGMGIDKPNIRRVIHYGCPKSLETYYQESGRCGRDGLPSKCWLYYKRGDAGRVDFYLSEVHTEERRKIVMECFTAAQKYCNAMICRRKYILEYFGEKVAFDNCGNCDNCTNSGSVEQRDMSREAYLLLASIQSCGGWWGLNVPIDVLRGARTKKILEKHYDTLPVHGLGKHHSANWWKALGDQLIGLGYLTEKLNDVFRIVSVSHQGQGFLRLASNVTQPPLILPVSHEMLFEESQKSGFKIKKIDGELESLSTFEGQQFSETEVKLYNLLLGFRAELARSESTAPYAICSEQTLQKLSKLRPSTKARLGNIDGVNQHLLMRHGDRILQTVKQFSESLELHLDGELPVQPSISRVATSIKECSVSPAKMEAWKMWQEGGLSFSQIANLPERPAPVKDSTIIEYILEVAKAGYEINWMRFFKETGFTHKIAKEIRVGIDKAGSKEKLKPIKEQIPEFVSYTHIKTYLIIEDLGLSIDEMMAMQSSQDEDVNCSKCSPSVLQAGSESMPLCPEEDDLIQVSSPSNEDSFAKPPWLASDGRASTRRRKIEVIDMLSVESPTKKHGSESVNKSHMDVQPLQITEASLLSWLSECDGASLPQTLEHFPGSSKDCIVELLSQLESEFLIYNKNNIYKVM